MNIEGKNEQPLQAIKNQEKKQSKTIKDQKETIKDQKENKPRITENDKIVYLKDEIDKLLKIYPNSFTSQGKSLKTKLIIKICLTRFCFLILPFI